MSKINKLQFLKICKNTFNEEKYLTIEKELHEFEKKLIKYFGNDLELKQLNFNNIVIDEEFQINCTLPDKEIKKIFR